MQHLLQLTHHASINGPAHSNSTTGDLLFPFAPVVWNSIQNDVKCAPSLPSFESCLMMYLSPSVCRDLAFYFDHSTCVFGLTKVLFVCQLFLKNEFMCNKLNIFAVFSLCDDSNVLMYNACSFSAIYLYNAFFVVVYFPFIFLIAII